MLFALGLDNRLIEGDIKLVKKPGFFMHTGFLNRDRETQYILDFRARPPTTLITTPLNERYKHRELAVPHNRNGL